MQAVLLQIFKAKKCQKKSTMKMFININNNRLYY